MPDVTRAVVLGVAWLAVACGGPPRCASSSACPGASVCGLDGHCGPLAPPAGARFAGSRWLSPVDWGVAGVDALGDRFEAGAGVESLVTFGPIPARGSILRALLVLTPHDGAPRVAPGTEVVVEQVEPYSGGALPSRHAAQPLRFAAARRPLPEGPPRSLRIDVTDAARAAADREDGRLYLLVRALDEAAPLVWVSPDHPEAARHPRLELMIH